VALVGISLRSVTPNFSVVRQMLGIGHFDLKRTYSKDARQGRTTQGFGVFCCLLTATALGRVTTSCADQRANWGEMRKNGAKGRRSQHPCIKRLASLCGSEVKA